jgi:thioredoxin-related protein
MKQGTWNFGWSMVLVAGLWCWVAAAAAESDPFKFDDSPLGKDLDYPAWFKLSFLDLREDLSEAAQSGKKGIAVYFGQSRCPYCEKLLRVNFGSEDIAAYTQKYFDVIPINIWGTNPVIDLDGKKLTEEEFSRRENTMFTPSLIFYDTAGNAVMRVRGYHPPYQFRAALEYVADEHYLVENFRDYLERGGHLAFDLEDLISEKFFSPPPYLLARDKQPAARPLVVFFEQGNCHACDVLHSEPLSDPRIQRLLQRFETVQLHIGQDTPLVTPQGERMTAKRWAKKLELFYTPTLLFFDENGKEILRLDSVVQFHRLHGILEYILSNAYLKEPSFLLWRKANPGTEGGQ